MNIIENPHTKELFAEGQESIFDFDGTSYAKRDVAGWRVVATGLRCVADWQAEPGNFDTLYGAITVLMIEADGRKFSFKMGDNISYLLDWVRQASTSATISYQWLGVYSDRNIARQKAN